MQFSVDSESPPLLLHDEPIYSDQKLVGRTTSGGLGFRTGLALCNGMITVPDGGQRSDLLQKSYEISVAGERLALKVLEKPVYDSDNIRLRG